MALGIQSAGITDQGIAPQGVITAPVQSQSVQATEQLQNNNHADNWLKQDLDNPFIVPWGEFDVNPNIDFKSLLTSAYGGGVPKKPMGGIGNYMGMNPQGTHTSFSNTGANDLFGNLAKGSFTPATQGGMMSYIPNRDTRTPAQIEADRQKPFIDAYTGATNRINFADKNLDAAIDALNESARSHLMPKQSSYTDQAGIMGTINRQQPKAVADGMIANSYGWAPVSRLADGSARDKMFADVASQYGIRLDDLQNKYGVYDKAFRSINEPVGANWQDLKSSPIYDKLLKDIRGYSQDSTSTWRKGAVVPGSTNDAYFDKINDMVGDYKSNPDFLPAEYFMLHQPRRTLPGRGGDNAMSTYRLKAMAGNQGTAHAGFSALPGVDPYLRQDWSDYADGNKAAWQYTPAEVAKAKEAMARHKVLLKSKVADGGPFNLMKEADVKLPHVKGGKYYWKESPYTGQLNTAQNMLYHNTQGEKSFMDAGYDANKAVRDSMYFKKKKKKGFLGGLGKILSPIASIASFIPGPWQLPAQLYNVAANAASGNALGAVANLAGAGFGLGAAGTATTAGQMGTGSFVPANAMGSFGGSAAGQLAAKLGGGTLANALIKGGLGAMSGYSSGNALKGGLTAALGAGVGGFQSDAVNALIKQGINPTVAQALVNAGIGAGQGAMQGDTALGAVLGGMGPLVNAGLNEAGLGKAASAFGTGAAKGVVQTKAQLDKQKKAMAKAIAQRNRGVT